ncbi:MAG TPA: glycosyltransferase [Chloroflexota bacterium]|nr:glycosyltransferase [Chloroflexota bacterium]
MGEPAGSESAKGGSRSPTERGSARITLLICTSGRANLLDRCLVAVASESARPDQVVVVNGTDGETPAVVGRHAPSFAEVVLVEHPNRNLATLRNLGVPHCTGDVVAMTDDDALPGPEWVSAIRAAHAAHPEAGGIGGPVRGTKDSFLSRVADRVVFPDPRPGKPIMTLPTVNMSYKCVAMETAGTFDETLFRGEDVDFNWRVAQAGFTIAFEPEMKVTHEHRASLVGLFRQQYMYGRAYVLVRSKWPDMYAVYPHSLRSPRSWAKLAYAALAILYQPYGISRTMPTPGEQVAAYPVLVGHHLIWKAAMLRQWLALRAGRKADFPRIEPPKVKSWVGGKEQKA